MLTCQTNETKRTVGLGVAKSLLDQLIFNIDQYFGVFYRSSLELPRKIIL